MNSVFTFDKFEPGARLGETVMRYDTALSAGWQGIFGGAQADGAAEAAGIAVVMMMRAYLDVVAPRPPGNVHARQQFRLHGMPASGEEIRAVVSCAHKELKRERRYVDLEVEGTGSGGRPIYAGRLSLIWAA